MMPIVLAPIGEENIIHKVGGSDQVKHHLAELGFIAGTPATVVACVNENIIIRVRETRVALDQELARKIMV